jgi:replicative DNA helicase
VPIYDAKSEKKLLVSAMEHRSPKMRIYILASAPSIIFGSPYGKEVRERFDAILQMGKDIGSAADMAEDPGLSEDAREFLECTKRYRGFARKLTKAKVDRLVVRLTNQFKSSIASSGLERGSAALSERRGEKELEEFCQIMEDTIFKIRQSAGHKPLLHIGTGQSLQEAKDLARRLTRKKTHRFITTGFPLLDHHIHGYERGNLVTLSANSGGGKTAMALNMALNQYEAGNSVVYVSMEMPEEELLHRLVSKKTRIPHETVRVQNNLSKKEKQKVRKSILELRGIGQQSKGRLTLWDVDDPLFTPERMELDLKAYRYDSIIVDYITLFHAKKMDTWRMHLEYSKYLKGMSKRMDCLTTALAQLSEDEQIRYGRAVRDNTDYWLTWMYGEDEEDDEDGEVEVKLKKARHTKRRIFTVKFKLDIMTIEAKKPSIDESGMRYRKRPGGGR